MRQIILTFKSTPYGEVKIIADYGDPDTADEIENKAAYNIGMQLQTFLTTGPGTTAIGFGNTAEEAERLCAENRDKLRDKN